MRIYFQVYISLHIIIFICTRCSLGPGVFDPRQNVCYVWLDSYNYNYYVVQLPEPRLSFLLVCLYVFVDIRVTRTGHAIQWQDSRGLDKE